MKKDIITSIIIFTLIFALIAFLGWNSILPKELESDSYNLNPTNPYILISPISETFRTIHLELTHLGSSDIKVTYIFCSDTYSKVISSAGTSLLLIVMNQAINISLISPNGFAAGFYSLIDRSSFLIPQSAYDPCISYPFLAYGFSMTILYILSGTSFLTLVYVLKKYNNKK